MFFLVFDHGCKDSKKAAAGKFSDASFEDGFEDYEVWGLESITLPLRVENASAENGKSGAEPVAHGSGQPLSHKSQHAPFWVRSVLWDNKKFTRF